MGIIFALTLPITLAGKYSPDRVFYILKLISLIPVIDIFSFGFLRKGYIQISSKRSICVEASYILKIFPVLIACCSFLFIDDVQVILIFVNGIITYFYVRLYTYRIGAGGNQVVVGIKSLLKRRFFNIIWLLLIPFSIYAQSVVVIIVYLFYYMELSKIQVERSESFGVVNFKFWQSDILQSLNNSLLGLLFNWNLISESNFFVLRMWTSSSQVTRAMAELKLRTTLDIKALRKEVFLFSPILLIGLFLVANPVGGVVSEFFSDLRIDMRPYVLPIGLLFFYDAYKHVILTDLQRQEEKIGILIWVEVLMVVLTVLFATIYGHYIMFVYLLISLALFVLIIKFFNGKY